MPVYYLPYRIYN